MDTCSHQVHDLLLQQLAVSGLIFIPDDQINCEPFQPPIGMSLHEQADQITLVEFPICNKTIGRSPEIE